MKNVIRVDFAAEGATPPDAALAAEVSAAGQALARALRDITGQAARLRVDSVSPRAEAVASGPPDLSAAATARAAGWQARRRGGEQRADWIARRASLPRVVRCDVVAPVDWLRDTGEATFGPFVRRVANPDFASAAEAAAWLFGHVLSAPAPLVSDSELDAWRRQIVCVPADIVKRWQRMDGAPDADGQYRLTLRDVVYSPLGEDYRDRLPSVEELAARGLREADARQVAEALAKFGRRLRT